MAPQAGAWELAQVLVKILVYGCMAASVGGILVLCLLRRATLSAASDAGAGSRAWAAQQSHRLLRHVAMAAAQGLLASVLLFLLQVGSINQAGLPGMFDPLLIRILAATAVGHGSACKVAGFVLMLGAVLLAVARGRAAGRAASPPPVWLVASTVVALVLFAASFALLGHAAVLGLAARVAIGLHVAAVLLWIGALLPLRRLLVTGAVAAIQPVLRSFGTVGWALVACLLAGGAVLLWKLLEEPAALFTTLYGVLLLAKLLLVLCMLALAALNRFHLVPALASHPSPALRYSIGCELTLALAILTLTALLTTLGAPFEVFEAEHSGLLP